MSENRANELSVKLREVFGDKSKLKFSENPKRLMTGVGLLSLAGGEYKHSHLKKISKGERKMIDEKVLLQSRPEALNDKMDMDLQNQKGGYNNGWNDCLFMFIDRIKKQPKVGKWIPVTERLPEEYESVLAKFYGTDQGIKALWRTRSKEVLVCIVYDDGSRSVTTSYTLDGKWHIERRRVLLDFKVIAWMPLPKPMKEEEK